MRIIDAQHHEPSVWLDWEGLESQWRDRLLMELELATLNSAGVSAAVLHPSQRGWAEAAAREMPDRFSVVAYYPPSEIAAQTNIDALIAAERENPAVVGLRVAINSPSRRWLAQGEQVPDKFPPVGHDLTEGVRFFEEGGFDSFLSACERERMPVFVFSPTRLDIISRVAERYPELPVVVDHLGLSQPPVADADDPPFRYLPDLLTLAQFPQVSVKLAAVPALSRNTYPYPDALEGVIQVVGAFGAERVMWGSDISRIAGRMGFSARNPYGESDYPGKHTYAESLHYLRDSPALSADQKEWIFAGAAQRVLGWPGATN